MIDDTGLNNCRGLDINSKGKLKAFCETRGEVDSKTREILAAGTPVAADLKDDDGVGEWVVPHGISNYISDITIGEDCTLFSYENLKVNSLHRHEVVDSFLTKFVSNTTIEAFDHGLVAWGEAELKAAANVNFAPGVCSVNSETADVKLLGTLSFPDPIGIVVMQETSISADPSLIQIASMEALKLDGVFVALAVDSLSTLAIGYDL